MPQYKPVSRVGARCGRPGCNNPLPKNKRVYCSAKCANKVANDRYRLTHEPPDTLTRRIGLMPTQAQSIYRLLATGDPETARIVQTVILSPERLCVKEASMVIAGYCRAWSSAWKKSDPAKSQHFAAQADAIVNAYR